VEAEFTPFSFTVMLNADDGDPETRVKDRRNARSEYRYGKCGHVI